MPITTKKRDRRSSKSKKTTERVSLDMGGRALTLFRLTEKATTHTPFWYCRCYLEGKSRQLSTKEENLTKAREVAKIWYGGLISRHAQGIPVEKDPKMFPQIAKVYLERCESLVTQKKRSNTFAKDAKIRYKNYLQDFFKNTYVYEITTPKINSWMRWRDTYRLHSKELMIGELRKELILLRGILKEAVGEGLIDRLPDFPPSARVETISTKKTPARTYFNSEEYAKLLQVSRDRIEETKKLVDNPPSTGGNYPKIYRDRKYLHQYIIFLCGTGMRPGEAQRVRVKDVKEVYSNNVKECHLSIDVIGKRGDRKVVSKYSSYFAYQNLKKKISPNLKPNDLLFPVSPHTGLRSLLIAAGLRENNRGETRDAKSFRHYYIMKGLADGQDIWVLSVQCGVDPNVIRNHYARHMTSQQFRDDLVKVEDIELL